MFVRLNRFQKVHNISFKNHVKQNRTDFILAKTGFMGQHLVQLHLRNRFHNLTKYAMAKRTDNIAPLRSVLHTSSRGRQKKKKKLDRAPAI